MKKASKWIFRKQQIQTIYNGKMNTPVYRKPNFSVASFQIAKKETEPKCLRNN